MKTKKIASWIGIIIGLIVAQGIGGLFLNGTMLSTWGLRMLPLIVHQVVGWFIIVGATISGVLSIID